MAVLSITATAIVFSANAKFASGVAGETITAGQVLYLNSTNNRLYKASANTSIATATPVGISANGASAGQPVTYCYEDPDFTPGGTMTNALVYILGATAGSIHPSADLTTGWYSNVLMTAKSTTKANFKIVGQQSVASG